VGILIGLVGSLIWGFVELMNNNKKIADNKERAEQENQKKAIEDRKGHERYITGALVAASLAHQSLALPSNEEQEKLLRRIKGAIGDLNSTIKDGQGSTPL
jgi:flagellar biosynthesis component FlhA